MTTSQTDVRGGTAAPSGSPLPDGKGGSHA